MKRTLVTVCLLLAMTLGAAKAQAVVVFGPRAGVSEDNNDFYLGLQAELLARFGALSLVPSFDFGPGTEAASVANLDLRAYLFHLPETGLQFYAGAGPTMMLSGDLELGLSLTLGLKIPMRGTRCYNVEYRWGLGDVPDHKLGIAVLLGL